MSMDPQPDVTPPAIAGYRRDEGVYPPVDYPDYRSSALRHPTSALTVLPHLLTEVTGPLLGEGRVGELDHDLTRQHHADPQGERIIVYGRVLDGDGRPVQNTLVEVWQANAAGRYAHDVDQHPAPLDPNFSGTGRCLTDDDGRYRFVTIKPGPYPWKNQPNAWRPAHIHFSLFGRSFAQRLVTQMYFPGDPLFPQDPIVNAVPDPRDRERLISRFDLSQTVPEWAMAYEWDVVLRGRDATWFEPEPEDNDA
jgi:protocatechuate 3,4-dioxygenase, beta subunit